MAPKTAKKKRPRTPAQAAAEDNYIANKKAAGEFEQMGAKFKTADDVAMVRRLRVRFSDLKDGGIVRLALRELDGKANTAKAKKPKR